MDLILGTFEKSQILRIGSNLIYTSKALCPHGLVPTSIWNISTVRIPIFRVVYVPLVTHIIDDANMDLLDHSVDVCWFFCWRLSSRMA